jgi:hypothetical protein
MKSCDLLDWKELLGEMGVWEELGYYALLSLETHHDFWAIIVGSLWLSYTSETERLSCFGSDEQALHIVGELLLYTLLRSSE